MKELTKAEEMLLLAILRLKDNAYGVAIKHNIQETSDKVFPYGTLYFILDQLTNKGLLEKSKGLPTPERGGRSKTYYHLTKKGKTVLNAAFQTQQKIWNGYIDLVREEKASE
ncbi:MAG: helix-turn-helix transcriptional regulator [Candidatus Aminicenantes bacterium]|nr:helix-turn-helix transcriptional regulator [Candidatus Aminicenantes bacterium]